LLTALNNVAIDLLFVLFDAKKGRRSLGPEEIEIRIKSARAEMSETGLPDARWIRRLKSRKAREEVFWRQALETYRPKPFSRVELGLLARPRNSTAN